MEPWIVWSPDSAHVDGAIKRVFPRTPHVVSTQRIVGLIFRILGGLLLFLGLRSTGSIGEAIRGGLSGRYTDTTKLCIIAGIVMASLGLAMACPPRRARHTW